jgi:hypothetical protein
MSDFLSRLVGRSLGLSEAVQPRVPSLYEPYRKSNGPLWARADVERQDESRVSRNEVSLGREPGAEDDNGHPNVFRPMESPRHTRPAQPAAFVNEPAVLQSVSEVTEEALVSKTGSDPVIPTGRLQPREIVTVGENLSKNPVPAPSPTGPPGSFPPTAMRPATVVRPATRPGAASNPESAGKLAVEVHSALPGGQSLIVQPAKSDAAIRSDPPTPSPIPAAKPGTLVVSSVSRPQGPEGQGSDITNVQTAPYSTPASEPSIRVSIGRVEVRAVFPTPPPRRAQTARPKPGLSLDEYLKRRNRGRQ